MTFLTAKFTTAPDFMNSLLISRRNALTSVPLQAGKSFGTVRRPSGTGYAICISKPWERRALGNPETLTAVVPS